VNIEIAQYFNGLLRVAAVFYAGMIEKVFVAVCCNLVTNGLRGAHA